MTNTITTDDFKTPALPKGGSVTTVKANKQPVYVEPWKPWHSRSYQGFEQWHEWMCYDKGMTSMLQKMNVQDAVQIYQIMNGIVYDIQRKNDEGKS